MHVVQHKYNRLQVVSQTVNETDTREKVHTSNEVEREKLHTSDETDKRKTLHTSNETDSGTNRTDECCLSGTFLKVFVELDLKDTE